MNRIFGSKKQEAPKPEPKVEEKPQPIDLTEQSKKVFDDVRIHYFSSKQEFKN